MLKEIETESMHFFQDEFGRMQGLCKTRRFQGLFRESCVFRDDMRHGEYKSWWTNGTLREHTFFYNDNCQGEFKRWDRHKRLTAHLFFKGGMDLTNQIKALVDDIKNLTEEDRVLITLKYDIKLC